MEKEIDGSWAKALEKEEEGALRELLMNQGVLPLCAIPSADYEKVLENFQPIPDLKVGDKVTWKDGQRTSLAPSYGEAITVYSTTPVAQPQEALAQVRRYDFSALILKRATGKILEYNFDSRYFRRVTE